MSLTDEPPPLDLFALCVQRWKTFVLVVGCSVIVAIAYGFLAPKWYASTLRVVPAPSSPKGSAAANLAAALPAGLVDTTSTDVQRIRAVLTSDSVGDAVIEKFSLDAYYDTEHRELTRRKLWSNCDVAVDRKSNVVSLTCEDKSPERAMQMAAFFGEEGNRVFRRVSNSSATEERRFLEVQVEKARNDVDEASRKLREFQEKYKIVDLPEQSKAVISSMASIQGEIVSKQLELSYLTGFASSTEPGVVQLQRQISIMDEKLKELESSEPVSLTPSSHSGSGASAGSGASGKQQPPDFFPDAMSVPELRFELEQLLREQKIRETIFFLLMQRFETAKVDEARDTSTFQILDHPTLPTLHSRPRKMRAALFGVFVGALLAFSIVVGPLWVRRRFRRVATGAALR